MWITTFCLKSCNYFFLLYWINFFSFSYTCVPIIVFLLLLIMMIISWVLSLLQFLLKIVCLCQLQYVWLLLPVHRFFSFFCKLKYPHQNSYLACFLAY